MKVASALVVDTSSWISYFSGQCKQEEEIDLALKEGRVFLSPLVAAELLSARLKSHEKEKLINFLSNLPLCASSLDHWIRVGELRAELLSKGLKVSTPDTHIAQCCLDLNCYLLTEDKIFIHIAKSVSLKLL